MGATMSQKPMMKKPARAGYSVDLSILSVVIRSKNICYLMSKIWIFPKTSAIPYQLFRKTFSIRRIGLSLQRPERGSAAQMLYACGET